MTLRRRLLSLVLVVLLWVAAFVVFSNAADARTRPVCFKWNGKPVCLVIPPGPIVVRTKVVGSDLIGWVPS